MKDMSRQISIYVSCGPWRVFGERKKIRRVVRIKWHFSLFNADTLSYFENTMPALCMRLVIISKKTMGD